MRRTTRSTSSSRGPTLHCSTARQGAASNSRAGSADVRGRPDRAPWIAVAWSFTPNPTAFPRGASAFIALVAVVARSPPTGQPGSTPTRPSPGRHRRCRVARSLPPGAPRAAPARRSFHACARHLPHLPQRSTSSRPCPPRCAGGNTVRWRRPACQSRAKGAICRHGGGRRRGSRAGWRRRLGPSRDVQHGAVAPAEPADVEHFGVQL